MCIIYLRNWQVTLLLYTLGVLFSEYIAKASIEPRDYRVVFLIQETPEPTFVGTGASHLGAYTASLLSFSLNIIIFTKSHKNGCNLCSGCVSSWI